MNPHAFESFDSISPVLYLIHERLACQNIFHRNHRTHGWCLSVTAATGVSDEGKKADPKPGIGFPTAA